MHIYSCFFCFAISSIIYFIYIEIYNQIQFHTKRGNKAHDSLPVTQKKLIKPYIVLLISSTLLLYSLTKLSGEIGHAYGAYLRTKVISS